MTIGCTAKRVLWGGGDPKCTLDMVIGLDIPFVCKVKKTSRIVSRIFQGKMVHVGNEVA